MSVAQTEETEEGTESPGTGVGIKQAATKQAKLTSA